MVFESQHSVQAVVEHIEHLTSKAVQDSHFLVVGFKKKPSWQIQTLLKGAFVKDEGLVNPIPRIEQSSTQLLS